jgi:hypothetical protein
MKDLSSWVKRPMVAVLVMLLAVPFGEAATGPPQAPGGGQQSGPATPAQQNSSSSQLPDSPQAAPAQQQNAPPAPGGTAAAPYAKNNGVTASTPAGAAIAPAKQRRSRSFAIRVGLMVAAAIAIGTVVGLSNASPSRP